MVNVGKYAMGNGVDVSEGSFSIDILFKQKEESTTWSIINRQNLYMSTAAHKGPTNGSWEWGNAWTNWQAVIFMKPSR